jgi:hypothetical protein
VFPVFLELPGFLEVLELLVFLGNYLMHLEDPEYLEYPVAQFSKKQSHLH